jgi:hypothetical protein
LVAVRTRFFPQKHGFHFPNRFDLISSVRLSTGAKFGLDTILIGLCGGMCFTALDYYLLEEPCPTCATTTELSPVFLKYIRRRQRDSVPLQTLRKIWDWVWTGDDRLRELTALIEFPRLRQMLDLGNPVVLLLIRTSKMENLTRNHQVIATGYELDLEGHRAKIFLYDPNHPEQEPHLLLDLRDTSGESWIKQSTGEPLRGFFLLRYKPKTPPLPNLCYI